jgi:hypothetical protein
MPNLACRLRVREDEPKACAGPEGAELRVNPSGVGVIKEEE